MLGGFLDLEPHSTEAPTAASGTGDELCLGSLYHIQSEINSSTTIEISKQATVLDCIMSSGQKMEDL